MPPGRRGFTLVELLLVLFIILLLVGLAAPLFSTVTKTSKVDQTTQAVLSALKQARTNAINMRRTTAVFYGDDFGGIDPKPVTGVLPDKGRIEIWTVLDRNGEYLMPFVPDLPSVYTNWYPFRFQDVPVTAQPITFPDGIRVVAGDYTTNPKRRFYYGAGSYYKEPRGEITRHQTVYGPDAGHVSYSGCHDFVVIFEVSTGSHVVVQTAQWYANYMRPKIVTRSLQQIGTTNLANPRQISGMLDAYPGTFP